MVCLDKAQAELQVNSENVIHIHFTRDPGVDLTENDFSATVIGPNGA